MFSSANVNQTQQNLEGQRHCILVAASNSYPLPTPVYRPRLQNVEQNDNTELQTDSRLSDAETVAKSFAQVVTELHLPFQTFFLFLHIGFEQLPGIFSCSVLFPCQLFVQSSFPN